MAGKTFPGAEEFIPQTRSLKVLRTAVQDCRGCDLYLHATQAVFGEGPASAKAILAGEQPGNDEDRQGHPFVGPAGKVLDRALEDAGIDRSEVYVTNVVKHFKFEERGKRRLHKKPRLSEVKACKPWLEAELERINPRVLVCLGATAAQAIMGSQFRLTRQRGVPIEYSAATRLVATVHPSAVLRAPDSTQRHEEYARLVADLKVVRNLLQQPPTGITRPRGSS